MSKHTRTERPPSAPEPASRGGQSPVASDWDDWDDDKPERDAPGPELIAQMPAAMRALLPPNGPYSWNDLAETAAAHAASLGFSPDTWDETYRTLGTEGAILASMVMGRGREARESPQPAPIARPAMNTLAIVSQKGGAGKTTLALNLAVAAELRGQRALILDIDPQASATAWADDRGRARPIVRPCPPHRIARALDEAAGEGIELALIDTAPHAEGAALAAARAADLIVIPCRPALFDLHAVTGSLDIARLAGISAVAVLNAAPARGTRSAEARAVLTTTGLPTMANALGQRVTFAHSLTAGQGVCEYEPTGKAAKEVVALYQALMQELGNRRPPCSSTARKRT